MAHYVYFTCGNDHNEIPGRIKVDLHSLDQCESDVALKFQWSVNKKWGREAQWETLPQEKHFFALKSACWGLMQHFEHLWRALGIVEPTELAFDYAESDGHVNSVIVCAPPGAGIISSTIGARGWPEFDEYVYRIRFARYPVGHYSSVKSYQLMPFNGEPKPALAFALVRMVKARVRLHAALRLPVRSSWVDLQRVFKDRTEKRRARLGTDAVAGEAPFSVFLGDQKVESPQEAFNLTGFFERFVRALGLQGRRSYEFYYEGNPNAAETEFTRLLSIRAPGAPPRDYPYESWAVPLDADWGLHFRRFDKGWNPAVAEEDFGYDRNAALKFAIGQLQQAKFRLTSALRVPPDIGAYDLTNVVYGRARAYETASKKTAA